MGEFPGNVLASIVGRHVTERMPTRTTAEWSGKKILLVENEEGQRLLYEQELSEDGYHVLWAKNGKEALTRLEESLCDLVILDIVMPEMDGIEVLGKIVSRYKRLPVILHTAYVHYQSNFMTWLADAFVLKSSDLTDLKNTVKELLRKKDKETSGQGQPVEEYRGFRGKAPQTVR